ncbi:hypothetical protein [Streptomyces mirabilis]|uniref:hypothetical protein n=1 Tax=Streptomyces mirabilis TaxID=68239 RepID=UPI00331B645C
MHDRYRVISKPPLSPPGISPELLKSLAAALNACGTPVADALDELTPDMVELAFNSITSQERQHLLRGLGINLAAPRRASKSLCRDVLTRMRREARTNACTCAVRYLVRRVMEDVTTIVWPVDDSTVVADPVARWGAILVRLAVFACCQASAIDAEVFVWAADQDWLGLGTGVKGLDAVREAAARVVEATPEFASSQEDRAPGPADKSVPPADASAVPTSQSSAVDARSVGHEATGAAQKRQDKDDVYTLYEALTVSVRDARDVVRRIAEALDDGRAPARQDLRDLSALSPAFTRLQKALKDAGLGVVPRRLDDLARAVEAHREERDRDLAARETLRVLLNIECEDGGAAAPSLATAHHRARHLLENPLWAESERDHAAALAALVGIVELADQPDALPEIMARQQRVAQSLPDCAIAALMYTELSLPAQENAPSSRNALPEPPAAPVLAKTGAGPDGPVGGTISAAYDETDVRHGQNPALVVPGYPAGQEGKPTAAFLPVTSSQAKSTKAGQAEEAGAEQVTPLPAVAEAAATTKANLAAAAAAGDPAATAVVTNPAAVPRADSNQTAVGDSSPDPARTVDRESAVEATPRGQDAVTVPALDEGRPDAVPVEAVAVETAVARLVSEARFGLAAHLSQAAGRSEAESAALRLAAAAAVLRSGSGTGARAVSEALQQWDALAARDTEGTELLLLPALIRAALVTGEHVTGAQLQALAPRLPEGLAAIATAVAERALSGALLIAPPMAVIADVSEAETTLREITEQCRTMLKPPRLRYNRATNIAKRWLAADGMLGRLLLAIANGTSDADTTAREAIDRLTRLSEIHTEIDRMEREFRSPSSRSLEGPGRQDLVHVVERAVECAKSWLDVTEALRRSHAADSSWAVQEISSMRQAVLSRQDRALDDLQAAMRRPDPLPAATAWAAHESLTRLFHELDGATAQRHESEHDASQVIDAELLKVPLVPGERPSVPDLLAAVDRSWDEALGFQVERDAFSIAHRILDLADQGALPGTAEVSFDAARRTRLSEAETRRRSELGQRHSELVAELRRAQADGALSEDQDVKLQELLADAHPVAEDGMPRELSGVRRMLGEVAELLPRYREEAADRLRARLDALSEVTADERAQVLRHLDTDAFATAADLVYFLELGEPVPELLADESHLANFFPAVPAGLPEGITSELIRHVRARVQHRTLPTLDYTNLSADEAARAANALDLWRELSAVEPKERQNVNVRDMLLPALSLLGYEARRAKPLHELPRSHEYRFADVSDIGINGRAWAPAFGTKILEQGRTLRVLMLWGRPSAQLLLSRAAKEPSGESLLVAYFGTLSKEARAELAAASAERAPLMVVDDAALAYLAAHGNRQVSVATETLLPFSGVNPYIKEKRGRIGREMFYGRDAERKSILDPDGTQIIFGGRGLGKSALLNDAGDRFAEQQPGSHHPVYLNLDYHNIGKGNALGSETIWSVLDRELTSLEVLAQPKGRRGQPADPYERVRSGIKGWLDEDPRRRLLILMDECDLFFEADVPHCTQTRRLKGLCVETRGRMKVVFAGLHSVQRFTRLARNGPFSHLAQTPTVVGPLAPQFAADLLALPMRALGFDFADVDLVNRVLGYCSYQPFLLQMFGSRLVEVMQRKRLRPDAGGPPYAIEATDVEAVESDPSLRADITAAFKETLTLDDRYNVIANVLAKQARDNGLETRLSDVELRDECASWWAAGFEQLGSEGFRAYLQEMVGLGVLAPNHDGRGWHLRGPNALRMIGTAQEIEAQLLGAETECELEETVIMEGRPELTSRRSAPLTVTQVDDLLGDHINQVRIVLGTPATGIGDVEDTLRAVTGRLAGWTIPAIGRSSVFRQELTSGRPGERRVIVSDLAANEVKDDASRESLNLALTELPEKSGVTRAVVLIAGTGQLGLWRDVLSAPGTAASTAVVLRRHDRRSLKSWTQRSELFDTEERLTRLLEVTGGWPMLLDRAVEFHDTCKNQDQALRRLGDELQQQSQAAQLVAAAGLTADPIVAAGYRAVVDEFGTDWADEGDLLAAIELAGFDEPDAQWAYGCLEAFQALQRDGARLRVEPVLHNCWSRS